MFHLMLWNSLTWIKIKKKELLLDAKLLYNLPKKLFKTTSKMILLAQSKLMKKVSYKSKSKINLLNLKSTNSSTVSLSHRYLNKKLLLIFHLQILLNKCMLAIWEVPSLVNQFVECFNIWDMKLSEPTMLEIGELNSACWLLTLNKIIQIIKPSPLKLKI